MSLIISVFVPDGIVLGTLAINTFDKVYKHEDTQIKESITCDNSHSIQFFSKFGFVFFGETLINNISFVQYIDEFQLLYKDAALEIDSIPELLLSFFKTLDVSVIGYLAGYKINSLGKFEQHVYLISFPEKTFRRINIDQDGKSIFYFHTCGQSQITERIFGKIKVNQGNEWIEQEATYVNFENFSLNRSNIFVEFLLKNAIYYNYINNFGLLNLIPIEMIQISRNSLKYIITK